MENKNIHRGWQRVLLIIIPYIFVVAIFQLIGALVSGLDMTNIEAQKTIEQQVIMSFSSLLATFLVIWVFMKFIEKEKLINLLCVKKPRPHF